MVEIPLANALERISKFSIISSRIQHIRSNQIMCKETYGAWHEDPVCSQMATGTTPKQTAAPEPIDEPPDVPTPEL